MSTKYTNLYEITEVQQEIILFIADWVRKEKVPIPRSVIIKTMVERKKSSATVIHSLTGLLKLGYLRRGIGTSNKTRYVLLRTL